MRFAGTIALTLAAFAASAISQSQDAAMKPELESVSFKIAFKDILLKDEKCTQYTRRMQWDTEFRNNTRLVRTCTIKSDNAVFCQHSDPSDGFFDPISKQISLFKLNYRLPVSHTTTVGFGHPDGFLFLYVITIELGNPKGQISYRIVDRRMLAPNQSAPAINYNTREATMDIIRIESQYIRPDTVRKVECEMNQEIEVNYQ